MDETKKAEAAFSVSADEIVEKLQLPLLSSETPESGKTKTPNALNVVNTTANEESDRLAEVLGRCLISSRPKKQQRRSLRAVNLNPTKLATSKPLIRESKLSRLRPRVLRKPRLKVLEFPALSPSSLQNADANDSNSANPVLQPTCSQQALNPSYPTEEETSIEELAAYFECFVHIPKKMSSMAEMMYT